MQVVQASPSIRELAPRAIDCLLMSLQLNRQLAGTMIEKRSLQAFFSKFATRFCFVAELLARIGAREPRDRPP